MLLLSADQVRYCRVVRQTEREKVEILPGIAYCGKHFIRGETFPIAQKKRAIEFSRQRFVEYHEQVYILIIEEPDKLTLWYESAEVTRLASDQNQFFSDFISSLHQLVSEMCSEGGVPLKTRRRGLKTFRQCFSGREAVNWLQKHLQISQGDAIRVGQRLLRENWLTSLTNNSSSLMEGGTLYRFRILE
mgnify:CR=1 FL=1